LENAIENVEFELEVSNASQQDISSSSSPPLEMPNSIMHDSNGDYYSIAEDRLRDIKRPRRHGAGCLCIYSCKGN